MKCLRYVCLMALVAGAAAAPQLLAQTPALQKGVSVQMAVTNNATPMPEADKKDAWIVAVTASGQLYFETQAVSPEQLADEMKAHPRNRQAKLYIKGDARAPYSTVKKALDAARQVMFGDAVLLTKQPEVPSLGMLVPPKGLDVLLAPAASSGAVTVRVSDSGQKLPELKVNESAVSSANLQTALNQALQNRGEKTVIVNADPQVPFGQVVQMIDAVSSVGAKAVLAAPAM